MNAWKLDDKGLELWSKADEIATKVVAPIAAEVDEQARFPRETIQALRDAGLMGLVMSPEVGGLGQGLRTASAVCERFARECPSTAMITRMHFCGSAVIDAHGNEELRRDVARNGKLTTLAFSESGSRSHFWVPVSTATKGAGGTIKLDAAKQLITAAGEADLYVWSSRPAEAEGLSSLWAVPSGTEGLQIPSPYVGLGLRGNASSPIRAEGVSIPEANRLGDDSAGFDMMMAVVMPFFSLQNCAVSLGMMEGTLARSVEHVTRSTFSYDGSRIADLPQVRGHRP